VPLVLSLPLGLPFANFATSSHIASWNGGEEDHKDSHDDSVVIKVQKRTAFICNCLGDMTIQTHLLPSLSLKLDDQESHIVKYDISKKE
jgi:hypothetical protein